MKMHILGSRKLFTKENFEKLIASKLFDEKATASCGAYWKRWQGVTGLYEIEENDAYAISGHVDYPGDKELMVWVVPVVDEDLRPSVVRAIMESDTSQPVQWPEAACHPDGRGLLVLLYEKKIGPRPCA